jgi:putative protease
MNTKIVKDIPNFFSGFLIDLRDIKTDTKMGLNKLEIIALFESYTNGNSKAASEIERIISHSTTIQYTKGI